MREADVVTKRWPESGGDDSYGGVTAVILTHPDLGLTSQVTSAGHQLDYTP